MIDLIVTGFGPFPGAPFNFSKVVVDELILSHPSVRLTKHIYATEYGVVDKDAPKLLETVRPAAIISFGIGNPDGIYLEQVARNNGTVSNPDAAGATWEGPIDAKGPDTLPATLPLELIFERLSTEGFQVNPSQDAGGYLCNFAFYKTALAALRLGDNAAVGFIHLPLILEEEVRGDIANDVRVAVNSIVNLVADWIGSKAAV